MEAKREAKSNNFSSKTRPWAKQGRLIHSLCLIFEGSKNRRFFDVDLGRQKIDKNRALEPQGPKKVQRVSSPTSLRGSVASGQWPSIKKIKGKKDQRLQRAIFLSFPFYGYQPFRGVSSLLETSFLGYV